jgi:hypothetical protein
LEVRRCFSAAFVSLPLLFLSFGLVFGRKRKTAETKAAEKHRRTPNQTTKAP